MPNIFTARCSLPARLHFSELLLAEELENTIYCIAKIIHYLFSKHYENTTHKTALLESCT